MSDGDRAAGEDHPLGGGDDAGDSPPPLWARLGVTLVVAAVVAGAVGGLPALGSDPVEGTEPVALNNTEYATDDLAVTEIPASGRITPDVEGEGTVVVDDAHVNEFDRRSIQPLVEAFVRAGYNVTFYSGSDLDERLENAAAYVVFDPGGEFSDGEIDAVRNFTDDGGRVLLFSEPSQVVVSSTGFGGAQLSVDTGGGERLARAYGLSFKTSYVSNQERNDGGYKNPIATPVGPAAESGEAVTLYTATRVVSLAGESETLLRLPPGSASSGDDDTGPFPVGVRSGNLVAVGDTTFLGVGRYNVADNEAFLAYLIEWVLSSERGGATGRIAAR